MPLISAICILNYW